MKFQNSSMHSSKPMLSIKNVQCKNAQNDKRHNSRTIFLGFIEKLTRSSTHQYQFIP